MTEDVCFSCAQNATLSTLPPRECVVADEHWRVAHAFGVALPGWLVLIPLRHVTAVADLTAAEAATLGLWQVQLSRALHSVLGCVKTYLAQFAEAEGFAHVHFHIMPRMPDLPAHLRGPRIFTLLGRPQQDSVADRTRDELALRLRPLLHPHSGGPSD